MKAEATKNQRPVASALAGRFDDRVRSAPLTSPRGGSMADQNGSPADTRAPGDSSVWGKGPVQLTGIWVIGLCLVFLTSGVIYLLRTTLPSCEVPAMSVTSVEPVAASTTGGDKLRIRGDGFEPGVHVRIGSLAA